MYNVNVNVFETSTIESIVTYNLVPEFVPSVIRNIPQIDEERNEKSKIVPNIYL